MSEAQPKPAVLDAHTSTVDAIVEIRRRGVPLRRSNEQILLGKAPPADVVAFVKERKIDMLYDLAAEEANQVVWKLKPAKTPTLEHEQYKADKDAAWAEMKAQWDASPRSLDTFHAFDVARSAWVVACRRLAEPEDA